VAFALGEVLVDGDAFEEAEAAFVALVADVEVIEDAAAAKIIAIADADRRGLSVVDLQRQRVWQRGQRRGLS
jgi:predicted RNA-binding protein with RPS1 domain